MKQAIMLAVLAAVGYVAYQHFFVAPMREPAGQAEEAAGESGSVSMNPPPPIPRACEGRARDVENAIYGMATGQASFAQRNLTLRKLQSCLMDDGFSDAHIDATIADIEDRVKRYLKQDGEG